MKWPFPIYQEKTCINSACAQRVMVSHEKALVTWYVLLLRLVSVVLLSVVAGVTIEHMSGQSVSSLQIDVAKLQYQQQVNSTEIGLLRGTVAMQADEISEMRGIGIGLVSILVVLQVAQIMLTRGKSTG